MEPDLARLHEALAGAKEVVTISPSRWHRRHDVERYQRGTQHFDRVALECRELGRWATTSLQYDEPVPEELMTAVERLAEALRLLRQETRQGQPPQQTRQVVLDAARLVGRARAKGLGSYADAMVTHFRTAASDLLRASGHEPAMANRMAREAAQGAPPNLTRERPTSGAERQPGGAPRPSLACWRPRLCGVAFWL